MGDFADESKHFTSINGDFLTVLVANLPFLDSRFMIVMVCSFTYYVRTKTTEDSLTVHYIDKTANQEFYSYNIAVAQGTYFNANIGLNKDAWKARL